MYWRVQQCWQFGFISLSGLVILHSHWQVKPTCTNSFADTHVFFYCFLCRILTSILPLLLLIFYYYYYIWYHYFQFTASKFFLKNGCKFEKMKCDQSSKKTSFGWIYRAIFLYTHEIFSASFSQNRPINSMSMSVCLSVWHQMRSYIVNGYTSFISLSMWAWLRPSTMWWT